MLARDPIEEVVDWNRPGGKFGVSCLCGFESRDYHVHADARTAARRHLNSARHAKRMREQGKVMGADDRTLAALIFSEMHSAYHVDARFSRESVRRRARDLHGYDASDEEIKQAESLLAQTVDRATQRA